MRWNYKTDVIVLFMFFFGLPVVFLFIGTMAPNIVQQPFGTLLSVIVLIILIGWLIYILKWRKKKSDKPKTEKKNE